MRRLIVTSIVTALLAISVLAYPSHAAGGSPWDQIITLLTDPGFGLAEIKREVQNIETAVAPPSGPIRLSSGLFALPTSAVSVDWTVVNDSTTPQTFTMTVYKAGVGPKTIVAPGPLTLTIGPGEVTHNANSVGPGQPFVPGFYYEMVIETASPNVLPTAMVWDSFGATLVAGTTISPGTWVRLR
jgi:hypothetical protein